MTVQVRENKESSRFEIALGDGQMALADYRLRPGTIVFTHTEVPAEHEGEGLGTALIVAGLAAARERGLKVVPSCPFFAAYFRNHPEERDLLDSDWRERIEPSGD